MTKAGDGIDHPIHLRAFGGDGAVQASLDREVVHKIRLLTAVDAPQIHQGMGLRRGFTELRATSQGCTVNPSA